MKELPLKNSDEPVLIDDEDYERFKDRPWHIRGRLDGPSEVFTYVKTATGQRVIPLRKAVLNREGGYPAVVHKDGNPLNCQKANLQEIKKRSVGGRLSRIGRSGRRGVHEYPVRGEWRVAIRHEGRNRIIGYWKNLDQAATAYDHAVRILGGNVDDTNAARGLLSPGSIPPELDAQIRADVEKAIRDEQPRYPRPDEQ